MGAYTNTGPFTNGSAPGIAAAFLNNLESFIDQAQGDIGAVSTSGGTSGTAVIHQILQGTVKITVIVFNNFQTGASNQFGTLPVAYTHGALVFAGGGTPGIGLMSGGSGGTAQSISFFVSGSGGGNATTSSGTTWFSNNMGGIAVAFDTVRYNSGGSSGTSGTIVLIGA